MLAPEEQQARVPRVLDDHVDGPIRRQPVRQRRPVLAEVAGAEDVGREVAVAMSVKRCVGDAQPRDRGDHPAHIGASRYSTNTAPDLSPVPSPVTGHLHVPVVGPHPEHVRVER